MLSNAQLIAKADATFAELQSGGGVLPQEKALEFWKIAVSSSDFLKEIRTVPVAGNEWTQPKIGLESWTFGPAAEFATVSEEDRVKAAYSQLSLIPKRIKFATKISYEQLRLNVEKDNLLQTIIALLGMAFSRDLAEWTLMADTATAGATMKARSMRLTDGVLKRVTANLFDANGVRLQKSVCQSMLRKMPKQFRGNPNLKYVTSTIAAMDYSDSVSNRQTAAGDAALNNLSNATGGAKYGKITVSGFDAMPEDLGSGDKTNVVLCDPKQIFLGMGQEIMIETAKDIKASCWDIVGHAWVDVNILHNQAMVKATNVLASA